MEELKEIGYEGGKTTHGDVRQAINANSEVANGNFDELSSAVQGAAKAAQGATETAQAADAAAGEAKQTAEAAKGTAEGAAEAAAEAQRVAGAAEEVAEGAAATAEAAQEAATGAQSAAETAARDAATAKQDAATAKSDAASAKSTAEGAQSTAETAASNASAALEAAQAAQGTADTAKETASTANGTAGAAKTAADKAAKDAAAAKSDAATAKSDAATANSTAETAKSTAETASQTAETAKSTAETAKQTAEEAKASAEGLTGDVTELRQQLGEVSTDATDAADGLHQFMTLGMLTQAPFPRSTAAASGSFAAVGGNVALKDGEIIPWTGWLTLALCYETSDSAAKVKLTGYAGPTLGNRELIGETAVAASESPRVVRITGEHDYNPERNGASDACMNGSSYHVNVEVQNPNAEFTLLWAVVYESDEYGNPRRRGGSLRQYIETFPCADSSVKFSSDDMLTDHIRYNERTGLFEMNGVVDLTWDEVLLIVSETPTKGISSNSALHMTQINGRTNVLPAIGQSSQPFNNFHTPNAEVIARNNVLGFPGAGYLSPSFNIKVILGRFNMHYDGANNGDSLGAGLENVKIFDPRLATAFNFKSSNISYDSLKYFIDTKTQNESDYTACTITVAEAIYNKLTGGTIENWGALATLASGKNITLLAKGDSGYPYLTEPFYRSYIGLYNKINSAANGSTIYIHTQDKEKITSSQQDDWGTLVTLAAEKNITFAQAE